MHILAIETSSAAGSVGALSDSNVLALLRLNTAQRGARSLAPALAELLRQVGWKPRDVQLIAVSVGPGSFTALRVGVTTAKTFAYAVSAEVIAVDTLEVIANQVAASAGETVAAAIDAQRSDVYAARYRWLAPFELECVAPPAIVAADVWLSQLQRNTIVTGPALDKLADKLPAEIRVAPFDARHPSAATVGQLAVAKYAAGQRDDLWRLVPRYLRKSAAEEKAAHGGGFGVR
jgi:tRNA threonylcarbamoyladenosine biosynthesis protein TsaB